MKVSNHFNLLNKYSTKDDLEWLESILLSIHDGVLVIDNKGIVKLINPEYTRITGVTPNEIIGKHLKAVRPKAQLINVLEDGKERVGIYRKEGSVEYMVDMAPIFKDEKIVGAVSVCKGLTEVHKLAHQLKIDRDHLQKQIGSMNKAKYTFDQIIGKNGGLSEVIHTAKKIAKSNLPILIEGESGTGKELFAQSLHNESRRSNGPFIPVNCASIPISLIESELFGFEEGSFTNSKKGGKVGLFEMANGGTIFLDEIGELPLEVQAKFLRVLQEQTIRKIGSSEEKNIDIRVIAATNRDLRSLIQKRMFRDDLFYRLNVLNLYIPPLRERKEDIPKIVKYVLEKHSDHGNHTCYSISKNCLKQLTNIKWNGNVRELKNTIKYAVCMTDSNEIKTEHLPDYLKEYNDQQQSSYNLTSTLKEVRESAESTHIKKLLKEHGNQLKDKKVIAKKLNISLATLYNRMKKYNINL